MDQKGVTLIELMVVIGIIGILAAISIPAYIGQQTKAARSEGETNLQNLRLLEEQLYAENGEYTDSDLGTCAKNNAGNIATIKGELHGFKPGTGLSFSYCIQTAKFVNTTTNAIEDKDDCFVARAFGNGGSRVDGEEIWVDCENNWHYQQ